MSIRATKSRPERYFPDLEPLADLLRTPPLDSKDRRLRMRMLGQRIDRYIKFMCAVERLSGSSTEAKDRAVALFYERLVMVERELGRIQENLQLE